jgi:hypothetical protein
VTGFRADARDDAQHVEDVGLLMEVRVAMGLKPGGGCIHSVREADTIIRQIAAGALAPFIVTADGRAMIRDWVERNPEPWGNP